MIEVVERFSKRGTKFCRNEECADRLDRASNLSNTAAVQFEAAREATVTNLRGIWVEESCRSVQRRV